MRALITTFALVCLAAPVAHADAVSLAGSEWGFGSGDDRYIQFRAGGQVSGHAGCNRFNATFTEAGGKLSIGPLAMTRMMCPPQVMAREQALSGILQNTRSFEASHNKLTLYSGTGKVMATLRRRDFD
jgi:heat shock protein HslJ